MSRRLIACLILSSTLHLIAIYSLATDSLKPSMLVSNLPLRQSIRLEMRSATNLPLRPPALMSLPQEIPKELSSAMPAIVNPPSPKSTALTSRKHQAHSAPSRLSQATPPIINSNKPRPVDPAEYHRNPAPQYPRHARLHGHEGIVLLLVLVDKSGKVSKLSVQSSSTFSSLDQAAKEAVGRWTFLPAQQSGKSIASKVLVPIHFSLTSQ